MRFRNCGACLLIAGALACTAQPRTPATLDVAAIRPTKASEVGSEWSPAPGGRFTAKGITLKELISISYGVQSFQVTGGPGWIGSDRWSVDAKAEDFSGRLTRQELQKPLQRLLLDRFKLRSHIETREMPLYLLTQTPGGPKLKPSQEQSRTMGFGQGFINGKSANIDLLCLVLETLLERPVVNQTSINGEYEIYLQWAPQPGEAVSALGAAADLPDSKLGSIFTELQEKLGLRLESKRAPAQIVVVESLERAEGN